MSLSIIHRTRRSPRSLDTAKLQIFAEHNRNRLYFSVLYQVRELETFQLLESLSSLRCVKKIVH